ncbi:MAG: ApaG domain, partial [Alphaproteobacteria bacterium]|nr:ApaG domain [Alphaproteobacteria bacterium]
MTASTSYAETTDAITIIVEPFYLDEQSEPEDSHYVWAYHVRIENNGDNKVQ